MKESDIKQIYWTAYTDVLSFLKKYLIAMDRIDDSSQSPVEGKITSDIFWDTVVDEFGKICAKHGSTNFVKNELLNALEELERVYREGNKT